MDTWRQCSRIRPVWRFLGVLTILLVAFLVLTEDNLLAEDDLETNGILSSQLFPFFSGNNRSAQRIPLVQENVATLTEQNREHSAILKEESVLDQAPSEGNVVLRDTPPDQYVRSDVSVQYTLTPSQVLLLEINDSAKAAPSESQTVMDTSTSAADLAAEVEGQAIVERELGPFRKLLNLTEPAGPGSEKPCGPVTFTSLDYDVECYVRQRNGYVFGEPLTQLGVDTFAGPRANQTRHGMEKGVVVIMSTSSPQDREGLRRALHSIDMYLLAAYPYPVAVIHEDFSTELMTDLARLVSTTLHFVKIEFKLPRNLRAISKHEPVLTKHFTNNANGDPFPFFHTHLHGLVPYSKRGSMGYYHMCRFFAGAGYWLPFFNDFEWVMRLDSDSSLTNGIPDYFAELSRTGKVYAFNTDFAEGGDVIEGLWNFVHEYVTSRNATPTFLYTQGQIGAVDQALNAPKYGDCSLFRPETYTGQAAEFRGTPVHTAPCVDDTFRNVPSFYTNFEVVRVSTMRSAGYRDFFDAVDRTGSIYLHRWGDAPLRFVGLAIYVDRAQIEHLNPPLSHGSIDRRSHLHRTRR